MNTAVAKKAYASGDNESIVDEFEKKPSVFTTSSYFYVAAALINVGKVSEAKTLLKEALTNGTTTKEEKANLEALDAFMQALQGNNVSYFQLATEAAKTALTPTTLYHLGLATPERSQSINILQTSVIAAEEERDSYAEVRNSHALSVAFMRAGRCRESLHWARYAELRSTHPGLSLAAFNTRAFLTILLADVTGLEGEIKTTYARIGTNYPTQRHLLQTTLADLYQATYRYEEAYLIYESLLKGASRTQWALLTYGAVKALRGMGLEGKATEIAETAISISEKLAPEHNLRAKLALAIASWPDPYALSLLEEISQPLLNSRALLAYEAGVYLSEARTQYAEAFSHNVEFVGTVLSTIGRRFFDGIISRQSGLEPNDQEIKLCLLGSPKLFVNGSEVKLRKRSFELLTLLLSNPQGQNAETLSEALYDGLNTQAVRTEIFRLRQTEGIEVSTKPYKIVNRNIWVDFLYTESRLRQGDILGAVRAYAGPLLPDSSLSQITELRDALETELRSAAVASEDLDAMWELANILPYDIILWEALQSRLPPGDVRGSIAYGRSDRIKGELDL